MDLADRWLLGRGIELGRASHNPLAPSDCISVAPCDGVQFVDARDLEDYRVYCEEQARHGMAPARVDLVAEATDLPFVEGELDYVASSHVLEHIPDIFSAWSEWWRVLKAGGVNFMIVPKRNALIQDAARPVTTLETHVQARATALTPAELSAELPWRTHYHVFTLQGLLSAVNWTNTHTEFKWLLVAQEETDSNVGNGHSLVLQKVDALPTLDAALSGLCSSIRAGVNELALQRAREVLSLDWRMDKVWFLMAMTCAAMGEHSAARQALIQALVLDPHQPEYLEEHRRLIGAPFQYPASLMNHLVRYL